jgi:hypothetical protein
MNGSGVDFNSDLDVRHCDKLSRDRTRLFAGAGRRNDEQNVRVIPTWKECPGSGTSVPQECVAGGAVGPGDICVVVVEGTNPVATFR